MKTILVNSDGTSLPKLDVKFMFVEWPLEVPDCMDVIKGLITGLDQETMLLFDILPNQVMMAFISLENTESKKEYPVTRLNYRKPVGFIVKTVERNPVYSHIEWW